MDFEKQNFEKFFFLWFFPFCWKKNLQNFFFEILIFKIHFWHFYQIFDIVTFHENFHLGHPNFHLGAPLQSGMFLCRKFDRMSIFSVKMVTTEYMIAVSSRNGLSDIHKKWFRYSQKLFLRRNGCDSPSTLSIW